MTNLLALVAEIVEADYLEDRLEYLPDDLAKMYGLTSAEAVALESLLKAEAAGEIRIAFDVCKGHADLKIGRALRDYIAQSADDDFDGFTGPDQAGIVALLVDLRKYLDCTD